MYRTTSRCNCIIHLRSLLVVCLLPAVILPARAQLTTRYGTSALAKNSSDSNKNTAFGAYALFSNTTGNNNTACGLAALFSNTTGNNNTASGLAALFSNTTGGNNTASGLAALYSNTTGSANTANGYYALYSNTTGGGNTASGYYALYLNTTGDGNTATGNDALYSNTTGSNNVVSGDNALYSNTTGSGNTALGYLAGNNIVTGSNNIDIGNQGMSADNGVIRIGDPNNQNSIYLTGINGVTASGGVQVYINSNGQLGTLTSSRRFKRDIRDMGDQSARLMQLRPVTFKYKDSAESGPHHLQYGLIAEEVAKVCPDLVQYDKNGKPFTIYYHLLTPMLLNEFQKEHRQVEVLKATHLAEVAALKTTVATLEASLQAQKSELASLRQAQDQQRKVLASLTAFVQTAQNKSARNDVALARH